VTGEESSAAVSELRLPPRVRYADVAAIRASGESFLSAAPGAARISLGDLKDFTSVVVALLLAWVRFAQARGCELVLTDVPADLRNIIDLYGVAGLLPLEAGGQGHAWSVEDGEARPAA
jgi:phospholipid transport system transporter-binding protein